MRRHRALVVAVALLSACTLQRWQPAKPAAVDDHLSHMSAADLRADIGRQRSDVSEPASRVSFQGTPGIPASAVTAPARLAASPRHGEWVKIAWEPGSKDSLMAWIVYPATSAKAPVVVVIHEIFGLQTWVRGVADQLAADGFIAIAPDLISRVRGGASTVELTGEAARGLIGQVLFDERNKGIAAAASYAMSQPSAEKRYGVVGYCWGGSTSFGHAVNGGVPGFSAAVSYYGNTFLNGPAPIADSLAKIRVPMMLLNGSRDARIATAMPAIDSVMRALGKSYTAKNYEGAIHGFLRAQDDPPSGQNPPETAPANLAASKDAWPMTLTFFKKHLGAK